MKKEIEIEYHVVLWDAFSDADNKIQLSFHSLQNSSSSKWRRNINDGGISFGLGFCFSNSVEDGESQVLRSALLRRHTAHLCQDLTK